MILRNVLTESYVFNTPYDSVSWSLGIVVVLLAVLTLTIRIIFDAGQRGERRKLTDRFDIFAAPLVIALAIIVLNRLFDLLPR